MIILLKENKLSKNRYIKYLIVGSVGTIPNYLTYIALKDVDFYYMSFYINIGWCLGILLSSTFNYILNEIWTWG